MHETRRIHLDPAGGTLYSTLTKPAAKVENTSVQGNFSTHIVSGSGSL